MAMHYDAQKRAQAEIDAVITSENRLPDINDRESMPYVCAIIKETLRCGTVAPFGIPHQLRENDTSNGYFIPKGSVVMVNTWYLGFSFYTYYISRVSSLLPLQVHYT
jgi:cytochrome P450